MKENVELVRKATDAFNSGGAEAMLPFYAADVVWYPFPGSVIRWCTTTSMAQYLLCLAPSDSTPVVVRKQGARQARRARSAGAPLCSATSTPSHPAVSRGAACNSL